jgi:hypothetical protein
MPRVAFIIFISFTALLLACRHGNSLEEELINKKWQVVSIDSTLKPENVLITNMAESMQYFFEFKKDSLFVREGKGVKDTSRYYIKDSIIFFKNNEDSFLKSEIKELKDSSLAIELFEVVYHFRLVK